MWVITVIGGGITGLTAAKALAEQGLDVRVIEEHKEIGKPVQCSGLLSVSGIRRAGIDTSGIIQNEILGAKIFSPSGYQLKIKTKKPVAYALNREKLDKKTAKKAEKAGAEFYLGRKLIGIRGESLFLKKDSGRGEMLKTKYLVGADGPNSTVRNTLNYTMPKQASFVHALQGYANLDRDSRFVEVYLGSFAPGLFGWVIPRSKTRFEIGVGARLGTNLVTSFNKLLEKINVEKKNVKNFESGLMPVGPPIDTAVKNFSLLVGDAAYQTKATTCGGIVTGTLAAKEAAKCIGHHFTNGDKLTNYDVMWKKELQKDLNIHWKIRRYADTLSDKQLDAMIIKANKSGLPDFLQKHGDMDQPSKFMPKLTRTIKFWRLFPDLIKFGFS